MYEPLKQALLELLRVTPEPTPPAGSPGSLRVFRASPKWVKLRLALWGIRQVFAVLGIVFILTIPISRIPFDVPPPMERLALRLGVEPTGEPERITWQDIERPLRVIELLAVALLVVQAFPSYAMIRLDWELRWYMTTDRSIRIREGTLSVREKTLTLTNVQNVQVEQNPIQRLLGIADVKVRTAGGGGTSEPHGPKKDSDLLHVAVFKHVEDAPAIRDLILARLKRAKDAGLGDPEDADRDGTAAEPAEGDALDAAREMLEAARALRRAL